MPAEWAAADGVGAHSPPREPLDSRPDDEKYPAAIIYHRARRLWTGIRPLGAHPSRAVIRKEPRARFLKRDQPSIQGRKPSEGAGAGQRRQLRNGDGGDVAGPRCRRSDAAAKQRRGERDGDDASAWASAATSAVATMPAASGQRRDKRDRDDAVASGQRRDGGQSIPSQPPGD